MTRGFDWLSTRKVKLGLLSFIFVWIGVVVATNVIDGLNALGVAGGNLPLASGNFELIESKTSHLNPPGVLNGLMFAGVILWESVIFVLFGNAIRNYCYRNINQAFGVSFGLFAAFVIVDDVIGAFGVENKHRNILIMLVAVWLYVNFADSEESTIPETKN